MEWLAEYTKYINNSMNFKQFVESDNKESIADKSDYYWKQIEKLKFPPNNKVKLPYEVGKVDDVTVCLVDGEKIKKSHTMDFTEGGHGYKYKFIPKDEIWIDGKTNPDALIHILLHEMIEFYMMKELDYSYEKAHPIANSYEKKYIE